MLSNRADLERYAGNPDLLRSTAAEAQAGASAPVPWGIWPALSHM
jgi:hypothetical protein